MRTSGLWTASCTWAVLSFPSRSCPGSWRSKSRPLVLVTLAVIYADSIRKAEVWKEVTVSGRSASDTTSDPVLVGSSLVVDVEQALPAPRSRFFAFVREKQHGDGPDQIVEKRWKTAATSTYGARSKPDDSGWARDKRWRKEELGWVGAFATLLRLYKLKKGVPPSHLRCD
ncbi:hypothetical protein NUW58_g3368 [Xylaria curta]|uniref:Uncharacterized protein n=1 Tax=Xylaria curta TaxID=42375 RepID=A0ACC1PBA8_9PEZI|nr:hypothetical protein NUW58_g3368 [Xylaria curta]